MRYVKIYVYPQIVYLAIVAIARLTGADWPIAITAGVLAALCYLVSRAKIK